MGAEGEGEGGRTVTELLWGKEKKITEQLFC